MTKPALRFLLLLIPAVGIAFAQQNLIQNTKHNLATTGPGTIKATSQTEICVFCHTPHGSSASAQLWNRVDTNPNQTYVPYSSDYLLSLGYTMLPNPYSLSAKSKLCMSCHDGTVALGSVYNLSGSGGYSTAGGNRIPMTGADAQGRLPTTSTGHLGTNNLSDDHPVGFLYQNAKDPELVVRPWPWNTAVKLEPDASTGTVECKSCHEPHNNQFTKFLRTQIADGSPSLLPDTYLCRQCHNKTGYATSAHATVVGASYTPAGGTATTVSQLACRSCHKMHSSGSTMYLNRGVEENTCYEKGCHGSNTNFTDPATPVTPAAREIQTQVNKTHYHPVSKASATVPVTTGKHKNVSGGESALQLGDAAWVNRHAECVDCHDPHQAQPIAGTITLRGAIGISAALKGAWGVRPKQPWPTPPTAMATNVVTFIAPSAGDVGYDRLTGAAVTDEYMVCLKCHSNYVTLPTGARNLAAEINPGNSSYHGIVPGGTSNTFVNATTANEPWATNKRVWCSDCHGNEAGIGARPQGPHGSNLNGTGPGTSNTDKMLVATIATDTVNGGTPLCLSCHKSTSYLTGATGSNGSRHGADAGLARAPQGCFSCHMWENPATVTAGTGKIFPHGMNSRWAVFIGGGAGSLQMNNAFLGGWYTNMNYTGRTCWTVTTNGGKTLPAGSPCNAHNNVGY